MHLFYTPDIAAKSYTLNEQESKHCIRALRLNLGDNICLIDGVGGFYTATIVDPNPKRCEIEILDVKKEYNKRNFYLHIAIAPTKNIDRFEWFLEKAAEIGIDEITPILCERSERKIIKPERLDKILISAIKQSIKAYKPKLNGLTKYSEFISKNFQSDRFIAHCENNKKELFKDVYKANTNALILIGPEGDFSQEEINLAKANKYREISLGNSRLRTETAGVVACHSINFINELS
ncbi:MAG: 16S rRNA (uracil(1498)-N(3))-methyltransferase [Bacteroidales bacterium]|nr:16S rRNA (uracil(1498)-N(3))-methyltransferase [Bacteroidales bacterium]